MMRIKGMKIAHPLSLKFHLKVFILENIPVCSKNCMWLYLTTLFMILRKNKKSPKYPTADWLNKRFSQMRWYAIYCSCFGIVKAMGKSLSLIVKCNTSSCDMITVLFKMCA